MATASSRLRSLAGGVALTALSFNHLAHAGGGLIDNNEALIRYTPALSIAMAEATGDDMSRLRAGGFMVDLEAALKNPGDNSVIVPYPKVVNSDMLQIAGVAPPKGFESADIPVCAQQNNKVIGTWKITPQGEVLKDAWSGPTEGVKAANGHNDPACKPYIKARRSEMMQKFAEQQRLAPTASTAPTPDKTSMAPGAKAPTLAKNP